MLQTVEGLLEGLSSSITDSEFAQRFRDCHLLILKGLQDPRAFGPQWTNKHITRYLSHMQQGGGWFTVCLTSDLHTFKQLRVPSSGFAENFQSSQVGNCLD